MIFLACWWGRFIDWLEGHEPSAQVFVVLLPFLVTLVLVGVTAYYAKKTGDIARSGEEQSKAAREQAAASAQIAEATLCPVIEQWIEPTSLHGAHDRIIEVKYANTGAGPAVNIRWGLYSMDRRLIARRHRIGMGSREPKAQVEFDVDVSVVRAGLLVKAEYESVLHALWRSSLSLVVEDAEGDSYLVNGEPSFERIPQRTIPGTG